MSGRNSMACVLRRQGLGHSQSAHTSFVGREHHRSSTRSGNNNLALSPHAHFSVHELHGVCVAAWISARAAAPPQAARLKLRERPWEREAGWCNGFEVNR